MKFLDDCVLAGKIPQLPPNWYELRAKGRQILNSRILLKRLLPLNARVRGQELLHSIVE